MEPLATTGGFRTRPTPARSARRGGIAGHEPQRALNPLRVAASNVSDAFLAKYERGGRDADAVLGKVIETGAAAYNLDGCSIEEWADTEIYQGCKRLHDIRQVIEAPIKSERGLIGTLHIASDASERSFDRDSVVLAEALGRITGIAVERLRARERAEAERDQAMAALELTQAAVVVSDPPELEPRLNPRARSLIAQVEDGEQALHRILARPGVAGGFSDSSRSRCATGVGRSCEAPPAR